MDTALAADTSGQVVEASALDLTRVELRVFATTMMDFAPGRQFRIEPSNSYGQQAVVRRRHV
jgi:hypothetical protein